MGCGLWDVGDKTASGDGDSRSSGSIQEVLGISSAVCIPCGFLSHFLRLVVCILASSNITNVGVCIFICNIFYIIFYIIMLSACPLPKRAANDSCPPRQQPLRSWCESCQSYCML